VENKQRQDGAIDSYPLTGDMPKKEAVEETLKELQTEKKLKDEKSQKQNKILLVLFIIFFPILGPGKLIKLTVIKMKIPLILKMLVVFSVAFIGLMAGLISFVLIRVRNNFYYTDATAYSNLVLHTILIVAASILVFTFLTYLLTSIILQPIRNITKNIDTITSDDLSKRLEHVDSQIEFIKLTSRINGLLDDIETTFKRQENFIADASHELKTPISVIAGYANMLSRWGSKKAEILNEGIVAIARESENMHRMAEKLLLLAKIGKMNFTISNICVDMILLQMLEDYKVVNNTHYISYCGGGNLHLNTDLSLFVELIRSLIDNAIRYTPRGGMIEIRSFANQMGGITISVSDTGIGIAKDDLPRIFDRFFRCDRARGRESGGTGLGLTIAKSIIETLEGKIDVSSEVDRGTVFSVSF